MLYKKYTIIMGLNDKNTLLPVADFTAAQMEVAGRLAQMEVGATLTRGVGSYRHDDGRVVVEESVIITVIDFDGSFEAKAESLYQGLKRDYNQESLAVEVAEVQSSLV